MSESRGGRNRLGAARRWARRSALQALYQWQFSGGNLNDIRVQFLEDQPMDRVDLEYFDELLHGVPANIRALQAEWQPDLAQPVHGLDPIERAILLIGTYELKHRLDVPYRVAINEAVELAKTFGGEQSHTFVNGVLDKVSRRLRTLEVEADRKR